MCKQDEETLTEFIYLYEKGDIMGYSNVGVPVFYVDDFLYAKSLGFQTSSGSELPGSFL